MVLIQFHLCGRYCTLIHLARATPPSLVSEALQLFDIEVRQCFMQSIAVEATDCAWQQAQLNLRHGDLQFPIIPLLPILPPLVLPALVMPRLYIYLTQLISSTILSLSVS